jgi:hypothetical protein
LKRSDCHSALCLQTKHECPLRRASLSRRQAVPKGRTFYADIACHAVPA